MGPAQTDRSLSLYQRVNLLPGSWGQVVKWIQRIHSKTCPQDLISVRLGETDGHWIWAGGKQPKKWGKKKGQASWRSLPFVVFVLTYNDHEWAANRTFIYFSTTLTLLLPILTIVHPVKNNGKVLDILGKCVSLQRKRCETAHARQLMQASLLLLTRSFALEEIVKQGIWNEHKSLITSVK